MTTMWKAHLNAYRLKHPRVDYKTAQKRASKTYQKTKKTRQKSFFWGPRKETIYSVDGFRQYLEKSKGYILEELNRFPHEFDHFFKRTDDCIHNLPIWLGDNQDSGAVFDPSLDLGQLCRIFYDTFHPYFRHIRQKTLAEILIESQYKQDKPYAPFNKRKRAEYEDEWHSKHAK